MRTKILALGAAALGAAGLAAAGTGADAASRKPTCGQSKGSTLLQTPTLRVLKRVTQVGGDDDADTARIYVCKPGSRTIRQIERFENTLDGRTTIRRVLLGGTRYLVLATYSEGGVSTSTSLLVYDLRTFRRIAEPGVHGDDGEIADAGVTTSGGVAWLQTNGQTATKVVAVDGAGKRDLATGAVAELAVSGSTAYWTLDGAAQGAPLTGPARRG